MLLSKKHLPARIKRKTLSLSEKIKLIDFVKKNPTFGCRKIAEMQGIGKTSVTCILSRHAADSQTDDSIRIILQKDIESCSFSPIDVLRFDGDPR